MARIRIECSQKDEKRIRVAFLHVCSFDPLTKECGKLYCDKCIEKNIEFVIKEEKE